MTNCTLYIVKKKKTIRENTITKLKVLTGLKRSRWLQHTSTEQKPSVHMVSYLTNHFSTTQCFTFNCSQNIVAHLSKSTCMGNTADDEESV